MGLGFSRGGGGVRSIDHSVVCSRRIQRVIPCRLCTVLFMQLSVLHVLGWSYVYQVQKMTCRKLPTSSITRRKPPGSCKPSDLFVMLYHICLQKTVTCQPFDRCVCYHCSLPGAPSDIFIFEPRKKVTSKTVPRRPVLRFCFYLIFERLFQSRRRLGHSRRMGYNKCVDQNAFHTYVLDLSIDAFPTLRSKPGSNIETLARVRSINR